MRLLRIYVLLFRSYIIDISGGCRLISFSLDPSNSPQEGRDISRDMLAYNSFPLEGRLGRVFWERLWRSLAYLIIFLNPYLLLHKQYWRCEALYHKRILRKWEWMQVAHSEPVSSLMFGFQKASFPKPSSTLTYSILWIINEARYAWKSFMNYEFGCSLKNLFRVFFGFLL